MNRSRLNQRTFIQRGGNVENFIGKPPEVITDAAMSKKSESKPLEQNNVSLFGCETFTGLRQLLDLIFPVQMVKDGIYKFPFPSLSPLERPKRALITGWPSEGSRITLGDFDCLNIKGDAEGIIESSATFYGSLPHEWALPDKPYPKGEDYEIMLFGDSILVIDGVHQINCFEGFDFNLNSDMKRSSLELKLYSRLINKKTPWLNLFNKSVIEIIIKPPKVTLSMDCVSRGFNYIHNGFYDVVLATFEVNGGSFSLSEVRDE